MITPERILVRSVNWLGDAVMSTSALQRLREVRPSASITLLCQEKLADLWKHQPFVDDVLTFHSKDGPLSIGRKLRERRFDTALILPNSPKSALETWLGRIPVRIGLARPWRNFFLTKAIRPRNDEIKMRKRSPEEIRRLVATPSRRETFPPAAHHLHTYLHLVSEAFGANRNPVPPRIAVLPEEVRSLKEKLQLSRSDVPIVGLNPGAEYGPAKRWPQERFVEFAQTVQRQKNCRWLIFGGKADQPLAEQISMGITRLNPSVEIINLAGRTSLRELCAAFQLCSFVLTNDTGPMHLAAAVGTPVIVPFGSTSPELTGPGLPGDKQHKLVLGDAPCAPCFLRQCPIDFRCLGDIPASRLVQEAMEILNHR